MTVLLSKLLNLINNSRNPLSQYLCVSPDSLAPAVPTRVNVRVCLTVRDQISHNIEHLSEKRLRNINVLVIFDYHFPRSVQQRPGFDNYITLMPPDYARSV